MYVLDQKKRKSATRLMWNSNLQQMVYYDITDAAKLEKQVPARDTGLLKGWEIILHFRKSKIP